MLIGIIQFIIWLVLMVFFGIGLVCVLLTDPITMRKEAQKKVEEKRKNREIALTNARKYGIIISESEGTTMKIIGKKRVGISLAGVWRCDICNKIHHTTTLANITQKNKKICDECLDKYKKM